MAKRRQKTGYSTNNGASNGFSDDLERLRGVVRGLLLLLEGVIGRAAKVEGMADKNDLHLDEQLFGAKNSVASTLVVLSDVMLRLNGVGNGGEGDAILLPALSDRDVALVEAFVRRMESAEMP